MKNTADSSESCPDKRTLRRIVCASDCPDCKNCGEPWCSEHEQHYAECACLGPHNAEDEGYEVVELDGVLYGIPARNLATAEAKLRGVLACWNNKDRDALEEWVKDALRDITGKTE